jgi:hypothetical protein
MIGYDKPYAGYLEQVTIDYFTHGQDAGLRGTHNQVLAEMPPALQAQVQPQLHDTAPLPGILTPPLLRELNRATLGSWGNYLGDLNNRGDIAPVAVRREVAVRTTLTMGLLGTADTVLRGSMDMRTPESVAGFHEALQTSLLTGQQAPPVPGMAGEEQLAALGLAAYMHTRLGLYHPLREHAATTDMKSLAGATVRQVSGDPRDVEALVAVAADLGEVTAVMALRHTELFDPNTQRADISGRLAVKALGRIGGYVNHGSQILSAVRDRLPTYATAILLQAGGATSAALWEIRDAQRQLTRAAEREGRAQLQPGNEKQRGIFDMAVHLLKIKERVLAKRGSQRQIDKAMNADPFWQSAQ